MRDSMNDNRFRLLVIDDDDLILQSVRIALPSQWSMQGRHRLENGLEDGPAGEFDAAMVDMHLDGNIKTSTGTEVIGKLSREFPHMEIVAMSGDHCLQNMEKALKAGATRFLPKPLSLDELHLTLGKIEAFLLLRAAATQPREKIQPWIGYGQASLDLQRNIANLRGESGPILIEGPSGAGKEVVAGLIHHQEKNRNRPFISVNVAAIPENLFESELFGHTKGAFTGADQNKMGLIEAAAGGDLFLDEIEALAEEHQAKLLRFLENGEIRKVGGKETTIANVRVIAATNRSLEDMAQKGEFREDLLWRLLGKKIRVPALKERKDDIPLLAKFFVDLEKPRRNKTWSDDAIQALQAYDWPGNVRELRRVCEQLCLVSPLPILRSEDVWQVLNPARIAAPAPERKIDFNQGLSKLLADYEAELIRRGLQQSGDVDATAKLMGISRSSLYKKIKDHGIEL